MTLFAGSISAEPIRLVSNAGALNNQALGVALVEVYRRAGVEMTITPIPAERAAYMLDTGEFDGVVGRVARFGKTRADLVRLEPPVNAIVTTAFFLKDRGYQIESDADLADKTVGVVRGIAHARRATGGVTDLVEVKHPEQLLLMLESGRIDVAVHGAFSLRGELGVLKARGVILEEVPLGTSNSHHFLRETFQEEAAAVGVVLRAMVDSGEFGALFQAERARLSAEAGN